MFKKFLPIVVLCVSLTAFWGTDAHAWPASSSGWGATQNTVTVYSGWKGISNADLKPTSVKVVILPKTADIYCINPGGNDGGNGVPYSFFTAPTVGAQVSPRKAIRNGRWDSYITFTDQEILDTIPAEDLANICQNTNWTINVVVKTFDVWISAFEDVNGTCNLTSAESDTCYSTAITCSGSGEDQVCTVTPPYDAEEVVHIQGSCDLKSAPINVGSAYSCETGLQWEYSRTYSTCDSRYGSQCTYEW
jgi:hypothetical protein